MGGGVVRTFSRLMRRRKPSRELFFTDDGLAHPADLAAPRLAPFARAFESRRWGPSSYNGQTTRAVLRTDEQPPRLREVAFCAATGSRFYAPVALGIWCANWELGVGALGVDGGFDCVTGPDPDVTPPHLDVLWCNSRGGPGTRRARQP